MKREHFTQSTTRRKHIPIGKTLGVSFVCAFLGMGTTALARQNQGLELESMIVQQQNRTIKGFVTDENGEVIIGANVVLKGTTIGTITDVNGKFSLDVPSKAVLEVSYIGYKTKEVLVGTQSSLSIQLKEDSQDLDEIVVVGYGTQKKVNLTGSVATVSGDQMAKRTVSQASQALQGLAPGLMVNQTSGNPGAEVSLNIRGIGSFSSSSSTSPLVLIDGMDGAIDNVNVNDIESISVLKDAASAAIYGSRAANGVIIITTKRAKEGKINIDVKANVGVQSLTFKPKYLGAIDYMTLYNEANVNEGKSPLYDDETIAAYKANLGSDLYPDTDWFDEVFSQTGIQQSYGISASGGSKNARALLSVNYINQRGNMINTGFDRYSIRMNTDITPIRKLNVGLDMSANLTNQTEPGVGYSEVMYQTYRIPPIYAAYYDNGTRLAEGNQGINPVAKASTATGAREYEYYDITAIGKISYEIIDGLTAKVDFSPRLVTRNNKQFTRKTTLYSYDNALSYNIPSISELTRTFKQTLKLSTRAYMNYDKTIKDHSITALAGFEQMYYRYQEFSAYRDGFVLPDYSELNSGDVTNMSNAGTKDEYALRSYFGRLNYAFQNKYLFEVNLRYDGSSRFAPKNRWGLFPSFSAGWRLSEESFMKNIDWLTNLKLTASWGKLGNQEIGYYPYISSISLTVPVVYDHTVASGAAQTAYSNTDISWETTTVTNLGLDFSLFNNSLFGTFEYYIKKTDDILMKLSIPKTMGLDASYQNAGALENKGWDLTLGYRGNVGKVGYSVTGMLSDVKNKITSLGGSGPIYGTNTITQEGSEINALYGYVCEGIFQSDEEVANHATQSGIVAAGDLMYKDINNDGKIDSNDRTIIGSTIPRYVYSLNLSANYKDFDFSMLIQGVGKKDGLLYGDAVLPFYNGGKVQEVHLDRWTPENTNASFPRLTTTYSNNSQISSFYVKSAAYLRLKNIQLGYSLPKSVCGKTFIKRLRVYVSADNLFQINNFWKGWDPEMPSVSSGNVYPQTRVISAGLDLNF
jgi:TonB-linked SusC/RagA family outer membrane protein